MADVQKIATREGYGDALKQIAAEHDNLVVLDADLAGATRPQSYRRHIQTAPSTVVSLSQI